MLLATDYYSMLQMYIRKVNSTNNVFFTSWVTQYLNIYVFGGWRVFRFLCNSSCRGSRRCCHKVLLQNILKINSREKIKCISRNVSIQACLQYLNTVKYKGKFSINKRLSRKDKRIIFTSKALKIFLLLSY